MRKAADGRQWRRPRHRQVAAALSALDAAFLAGTECWFGGGTRIVLELDEYRESADLDFLCASLPGYRSLRSTVAPQSLGAIVATPVPLARDVRADRYGIRTFLAIDTTPLKLELILEGRIALASMNVAGLPVRCLDHTSCFAEKFLANADRWGDVSVHARDLIDLAFMFAAWGPAAARQGLAVATGAYGSSAVDALDKALAHLRERPSRLLENANALAITDVKTLRAGLEGLQAKRWRTASGLAGRPIRS